MGQWVPIYELTLEDLKSIVRTFGENFRYMMLWLTHYDAELVGSNEPFDIDEEELDRRIRGEPLIMADLGSVDMGAAADFLSYFVMGTEELRRFSRDGVINTDDNLYLEFSAPRSKGVGGLMGGNVEGLTRHRESILSYLRPASGVAERENQGKRWERYRKAAGIYDRAHSLFMWDQYRTKEFAVLSSTLDSRYPDYAPGRFLRRKYIAARDREPQFLRRVACSLAGNAGERKILEISAVRIRISEERAVVMFVDNRAREVYGQLYLDGRGEDLENRLLRFADDVMNGLEEVCRNEAEKARGAAGGIPDFPDVSERFRGVIASKVWDVSSGEPAGK